MESTKLHKQIPKFIPITLYFNFKKLFKASDYTIIGKCTGSDVIEFKDNKKIMRGKISDFAKSYKQNIKGL